MRRFLAGCLALLLAAALRPSASGQTDAVAEARAAMSRGEYSRAVTLLSAAVAQNPSADAYLYLGIAYGNTREWQRAEETLRAGAGKYPQDPRFHNELAGVYLAANDLERARQSLRDALAVDPEDRYARDLLATVDMSMGNVEAALEGWNREGRPIVGEVLHNGHVESENWLVDRAAAFQTGDTLTWSKWKTTEARLWESGVFSNVGVEIEPTIDSDLYNAVIRTAPKGDYRNQIALQLLEAAFLQSVPVHWWNIANSGTSFNGSYRFATNRHRAEAGFSVPIPLPGVLFFEGTGIYRSERWDISRPAQDTGFDSRFRLQSTGFRAMVKHIPHYRVEFGAGFEYRNRTIAGEQPGLSLDSRNTGKLLIEASVIPVDGRYRNRIRTEVFAAREEFRSDIDYTGGTLEFNNEFLLDAGRAMDLDITVKGGASRGPVPIDDYFVLGLRYDSANPLRGHSAVSSQGHYGHSPMGTTFVLVNTTVDRRLRRIPLLNSLNIPYVDLKWQFFLDGAKTFDRADVFNEGKLLVDIGGGFKLETPTRAFHVTYGRSLRDGAGTLAAWVEQRW